MSRVAIRVDNLSKQYRLGGQQRPYRTLRESLMSVAGAPARALKARRARSSGKEDLFWALRDLSFEINAGEVVGVIGRNGAGKSTLLKILSRITDPSGGKADLYGRIGSLLEVGTGFHGELTGRENIFLNGAILGMKKFDIQRQFDRIVAFAEVEKFVDTPVKHYSTGMYLRLAFAVAAHLDPEILLIDEVLAVGDAAFQRKCVGRIGEVADDGRTVLFVSHNMGAIRSLCRKGLVLEAGKVAYFGDIAKSTETYFRLTSSPSAAEESGARRGFTPITLADNDSSTIEQGESFEIRSKLSLPERTAGFTLICILEDSNQRQVFHLRAESTEFQKANFWNDECSIRLRVPPLWLEPGGYSLFFKALLWGESAQARIVSDTFHLDVAGSSNGWNSILSPRVEWSLKSTSEAVMA